MITSGQLKLGLRVKVKATQDSVTYVKITGHQLVIVIVSVGAEATINGLKRSKIKTIYIQDNLYFHNIPQKSN